MMTNQPNQKAAGTLKTTWSMRTYDVWGNAREGYEVNDSYNAGEVELRIPITRYNVGTPQEFRGAYPTMRQVKRAFGVTCRIELDGDDTTIYVNRIRDGYPIGEMHCESHESLSPIRESSGAGDGLVLGRQREEKTNMRELIKTWRKAGFTLRMWDTGRTDSRGQSRLAYELKDGRRVVFSGDDFAGSPMHADDSLSTVAALLGFLTLKPGDTDREYFDSYTPEQMDWCQSARCEELGMIQVEMEERQSARRS